MAEVSVLAQVTKKETHPVITLYLHLLDYSEKALKTSIPSDRGQNECGISVGSEVLVITNSPLPSKIDAKECGKCRFTTARGAKPPLVCNIYRYNR